MSDFLKFLKSNKKTDNYLTATVATLNPLTAKIIPTDDAVNVVMTNNLAGIVVGSRILMLKFLDQFIGIAVLGNHALTQCILRRTTAQSIPTATATEIEFGSGTEVYDPLSMHDTSTNNTRITIPIDGMYHITAGGRFSNSTGGSSRILYISVNGGNVNSVCSTIDSSGRWANTNSITHELSVNDYVEMSVYQNVGTNLDFGGSSYNSINFSVIKI
jgi:hypothetical protein